MQGQGVEITYAEEIDKDFDPNAELTTDVLADDLGDFYSREDEDRLAQSWEMTHGRPLKRSYEAWSKWQARKKAFKPLKATKTYSLDRQSAIENLQRLLKIDEPSEDQKREAHALEEMLDREKTDFAKRPAAADSEKATLKRFELITQEDFWADRLKAVAKERDVGTLNLVSMRDTNPEVRRAAQMRILELAIR